MVQGCRGSDRALYSYLANILGRGVHSVLFIFEVLQWETLII
jgi:hypothetical protein